MTMNMWERFIKWVIEVPEYKIPVYGGAAFIVCLVSIIAGANLKYDPPPYLKRNLMELNHRDYPMEGVTVGVTCTYNHQQVVYNAIDWIEPERVSVNGVVFPIERKNCFTTKL